MADKDLTKISASKEDIYTKLLDIAGKYTDIENTDYLKTGLFGYITESLAMMIRDSALQDSMVYRESTLNTAIIPETVYNYAKMFNIEVNKAIPSYANIQIIIPLDSLAFDNTEASLTISKENPIIAGDYYFMLEHSIKIQQSNNNYIASYDVDNEYASTNYQTLKSNKLNITYNTDDAGEKLLQIEARAYQYKLTKIQRQLTSSTYLNKVQFFDFDDQFAGARLFYNDNANIISGKDEIELLYSNIKTSNSEDEKFAYYSLTSENQLEINFKAGPNGFIPAANSKITLYLYTTKGTDVPSSYTGDATFKFSEDKFKRMGIIVRFNPGNIIGGQDVPSVEKIKQTIIKQLSTCNTIVTESDLNAYFDILTKQLETINDGKVTFIKRRDDILKRIFSSYVLLRDGLDEDGQPAKSSYISKCIPTNTIDIRFNNPSEIYNKLISFPLVRLNSNNNYYEYAGVEVGESKDFYAVPFSMYIAMAPVKKVKYIYTLVDNSTSLSFYKGNDILGYGKYLTPISIRAYRGISSKTVNNDPKKTILSANDSIKLYFKFTTNMTQTELTALNYSIKAGSKSSLSNLSIIIKDGKADITVIGDDLDSSEEKTVELVFTTKPQTSTSDGNDLDVDKNGNLIFKIDESIFSENNFVDLVITNESSTDAMEFISDSEIYFYRNLDDIMLSNISTTLDSNDKLTGVIIHDVPVIWAEYLNSLTSSDATNNKFIEQLFVYINLLKEHLEKLETSTFFDLKFYNTYGPSQFYNTTTTNIRLDMVIHLNQNQDDLFKTEVKSYIRRAIDKFNESGSIKISTLIGLLGKDETYAKYINYIEFGSLNGTYSQYIAKDPNISEKDFAPEWLNITAKDLDGIQFVTD